LRSELLVSERVKSNPNSEIDDIVFALADYLLQGLIIRPKWEKHLEHKRTHLSESSCMVAMAMINGQFDDFRPYTTIIFQPCFS